MEVNKIYYGDCLIENKQIESGSVDLILTDLPYGIVRGQGNSPAAKQWGFKNSDWDLIIEPIKIYKIADRILRKNGKMILFGQEPYISKLISSTIPNLPFGLKMIWEKDNYGSHLKCNKAPLNYFEEILVFSKCNPIHDFEGIHPLRGYALKIKEFTNYSRKRFCKIFGHEKNKHFLEDHKHNNLQFSLCTEQTYNELIEIFRIDKMEGFLNYNKLKQIDLPFKNDLNNISNLINPSIFNLWEGKKYKSNILKYKKDYDGYHPTQKPISLLEDLIKTFSNEGDLVVDLTAGSGSTAVACINLKRYYILIEKEKKYVEIAKQRISAIPGLLF